jgi:hypothetical protein
MTEQAITSLDVVVAKEEIRDVLTRYCRAMDRMDHDLALSVWHPEATCDYIGMYTGSGAGFVDWVEALHRKMIRHTHRITNMLIEVDGDHARSETYVHVVLWRLPIDAPKEITATGRYLDRWSKRDGRWALDHRIYFSDLVTTRLVSAEEARIPLDYSRRDRSDPSYKHFAD